MVNSQSTTSKQVVIESHRHIYVYGCMSYIFYIHIWIKHGLFNTICVIMRYEDSYGHYREYDWNVKAITMTNFFSCLAWRDHVWWPLEKLIKFIWKEGSSLWQRTDGRNVHGTHVHAMERGSTTRSGCRQSNALPGDNYVAKKHDYANQKVIKT